MAESHVVSGLIAKHAELAGIIQFHRTEIERVAVDLKHVDATIKLFSPETDLRSLGAKRVTSISTSAGGFKHFKSSESQTMILDQLRVAAEPLSAVMICTAIMADRGMEDTKELRISIVHAGVECGYEPDKLKLPSFVTRGIKLAMERLLKAEFKMPVFAKVMLAPGYSEPAFPLPRLVDEDGVIDPVTSCSNADKVIRQRRACFLRFEYESGDLIRFAVVIEAQKISQPPEISIVHRVELAEVIRVLTA